MSEDYERFRPLIEKIQSAPTLMEAFWYMQELDRAMRADPQNEQNLEPEEWLDTTQGSSPDEPPFTPDDPDRVDPVLYSPTEGTKARE